MGSTGRHDGAPAWLVRWLKNLIAVVAIVGLIWWAYYLATMGDRLDRDLQRQNIEAAKGAR